jgi:hypothetical protein
VNALLAAWQASPVGEAVRAAGVWAYAVINTAHIIGIATLFGAILVLDLRLLGWRSNRPLHEVAAGTVPVAATGLLIAAVTGPCLLATNATEYSANPYLPIKLALIAAGLLNLALLHRARAWRAVREHRPPDPEERRRLAIGGGVSLAGWLATIVAGRLLAYA